MGRFMSPDWSAQAEPVPYAKLDDPQTLNLYSYERNNPLSGADPDGHCDWCQKLLNGLAGYGYVTNDERDARIAEQRQWLINNSGDDKTKDYWKNASGKAVFEGYVCTQSSSCMQNAVASGQVNITPPSGTPAVPSGVGSNVQNTLDSVDQTGKAPTGQQGGREFMNDGRGGGQQLPQTDANGNPIKYQEWDVNAKQPGVNRGAERLVTGSDGSAYYTADHYQTFTKIR
jgi:guanyl-specific ribonuclease Sa